jgi:hypothetical protein
MREITSHKVAGLNEALQVVAMDPPGPGNACHDYLIRPSVFEDGAFDGCTIFFQNGPLSESDLNGVSDESLLAVVEDRLLGFQSGEYSCRENAIALTHIQEAMMWLQKRTRDRLSRGVEGTSRK